MGLLAGKKITQVVVMKEAANAVTGPGDKWSWYPMDSRGKVRMMWGGVTGYSRRQDAARGARRACGNDVKIRSAA